MDTPTIGSNLLSVREVLGHTQSSLASKSGVSQAAISAIESGKKSPTIGLLVRIKRALGCTWDSLLRGID